MHGHDDTPMIEVRCLESGDIAWAETPEAALAAARTLCTDGINFRGRRRSVLFLVDGKLVRSLAERDLRMCV